MLRVAVKEWNIMLAEALLARDDLDVKHCHKLLFEVSRRTAELTQSPERNEMLALFLKSGRFDLNEANECGLNTFVMYLYIESIQKGYNRNQYYLYFSLNLQKNKIHVFLAFEAWKKLIPWLVSFFSWQKIQYIFLSIFKGDNL